MSTDNLVSGNQITVKSEVVTKAGYEGTETVPSEFIMDINQGEESYYNYSLVKMTKESDSNIYRAPKELALTWAGNDHSKVTVKAITMPYGVNTIDPENPMSVSVRLDQTTEDKVKESDLLGAKSGNDITIVDDDINIAFNHLMAKLYVTYSFKSDLDDNKVKVTSVTLKNTCVSGGYSYASMDYDKSVALKYGDIAMYNDVAAGTAECLFYPYVPSENAVLSISVSIDDTNKDFNIPVVLKSTSGFVGGKRYKMNIKISGNSVDNSSVTVVKEWIDDSESIETIADQKILWIGTSIPCGNGDNSYPRMIAKATGCEIVNNAVGGSFVSYPIYGTGPGAGIEQTWNKVKDAEDGLPYTMCLSSTYADVDARYRSILERIAKNSYSTVAEQTAAVEGTLDLFKSFSYESLIIPYINGEKDNCTTIVIDHGFNDRLNITWECLGYPEPDGSLPSGLTWMEVLRTGNATYQDVFNMGKQSYIQGLSFVIEECKKVNPNINIIIGNYFATTGPYFGRDFAAIGGDKCCELMLKANEAVAYKYGLETVNVYKFTGLDIPGNYTYFMNYCPDEIHPASDPSGYLNNIISSVYINEFRRIFSGK